jgi:enoyl-CoA hydratase
MSYETILVERSPEGFATLTLNRPAKLNTLSIELRQELAAAIDDLQADTQMRVLVLTGAGRAFSAGLDIDEWGLPGQLAAGAYEFDAVQALLRFEGPVIGAINGLTVTGGLELALACDLLLASSEARFADSHARVGLLPGWGGSVRLARCVGLRRAKELALSGRWLGAEEALSWGLVNHVFEAERLLPEAHALARDMLRAAPGTLAAYKRLFDAGAGSTFAESLRLERQASLANNSQVTRVEIDERLSGLRGAAPGKPVD